MKEDNKKRLDLIDSHIHFDFAAFEPDRASLIAQATNHGIKQFLVPATTIESWESIAQLCKAQSALLPAYGIHPYFVQSHSLADCKALLAWISTHPCVAIGETGLDFFRQDLDQAHQVLLFEAQLEIAKQQHLPVILHARKAVEAVIDALKKYQINKGIVHSFNGSYVQATRLIDMGFMLGFGGAITYPRATRLHALIKKLPLSSICLETDAPDQPSYAFSGKRNAPLALIEVCHTIAKLRGIKADIVAQQTTLNTQIALNLVAEFNGIKTTKQPT